MASAAHVRASVLLRSEDSHGHVAVVEIEIPPHSPGPPLHVHEFDEVFFVVSGELTVQVEHVVETRRPGQLAFAPRSVAHAVANHRDEPVRYVLVCTPGGFERHWARVAAGAADSEPPRWAMQDIPPVVVVGPQIALRP